MHVRLSVVTRPAVILAGLMLTAVAARADGALSLTWNDCPLAPTDSVNRTVECGNGIPVELFLSFQLSQPADSVIGLEAYVDIQSTAATLPAWWQYGLGGCRNGALIASATFPGHASCTDFWNGEATFDGSPQYTTGGPHGGEPDQATIHASFVVLSSAARQLAAGTRYYAIRLVFQNDATPACSGCSQPTCLVLNSITLARVRSGSQLTLETPAGVNANWATFQGSGADCAAVPTRPLTWGRLKALYR